MHHLSIGILFTIGCSFSWAQLPFIQLSANGAANAPSGRHYHSFDYDNNGGFWIFGGYSGGRKNDLWRFNRATRTFTFVDGSNNVNDLAMIANKPTARDSHASWVDSVGNLWIFGGWGFSTSGTTVGKFSRLGDTWVYSPSSTAANKWRLVTGSQVPDQGVPGTLQPRFWTGQWRDVNDNCLYIFAGDGSYTQSQSVWKLNPAVSYPTWQVVDTSNQTQPQRRYSPSCDAAPNSGAFCFGGMAGGYVNDFWQFNPTSNPKWTQITQPNGPSGRTGHELIINRAAGKVYVLFGSSGSTDIYSFRISTQEWSTIVSSSAIQREHFGADFDDRNTIHYFGGRSGMGSLNDVVSIACLFGEFNNAGTCSSCSGGSFSLTYNAATCNTCAAGYQSSGTSCVACSLGTFKQAVGLENCTPCEAGSYSSQQGRTVCTKTAPGTYQDLIGQTSFKTCVAGMFQDQIGQRSCVSCPLGSFNSQPGSVACNQTAVGTFQDVAGATSFKLCPAGTFQNETGASNCKDCQAGSYQPDAGRGICIPVPAGSYQDLKGQTTFKLCPPGTYSTTEGGSSAASCLPCPINTFSNETGARSQDICIACPSGAVTNGNTGSTTCFCPQNYYGDPNTVGCTACPLDSYRPSPTSRVTTVLHCTTDPVCPGGEYGDPKKGPCQKCALNSYRNEPVTGEVSFACQSCPERMVTLSTGSINITDCLCDAGYYRSGSTCLACPPDSFKSNANNTNTCPKCPIGSTTNGLSAQAGCDFCLPGYYFSEENGCRSCSEGTYQPLTALKPKTCLVPPANAIANSKTSWICKGGYKLADDKKSCVACGENEYKLLQGNDSCIPCLASFGTSGVGATSCSGCRKGFFSKDGNCTECEIGTFTSTTNNNTVCEKCKPGVTNLAPGSYSCDVCDVGYGWDASTSTCMACADGYSKPNIGSVPCSPNGQANNQAFGGNTGILVGAIIGGLAVVGAGVGAAIVMSRKSKKGDKQNKSMAASTNAMIEQQQQYFPANASGMNMSASQYSLNPNRMSMMNLPVGMATQTALAQAQAQQALAFQTLRSQHLANTTVGFNTMQSLHRAPMMQQPVTAPFQNPGMNPMSFQTFQPDLQQQLAYNSFLMQSQQRQ